MPNRVCPLALEVRIFFQYLAKVTKAEQFERARARTISSKKRKVSS